MEDHNNVGGTQSVRRALQLLRILGERHKDGIKLSEVVQATGLELSTAHRLLACLVDERFADKDGVTKAYRLDAEAMQLGLWSMSRVPLVSHFRGLMKRLARITEEEIFLQMREGDYGVCLHREPGSHLRKLFSIEVGGRRLLGIGAGGLAMLANLEDKDIADIYERNSQAYERAGLPRPALRLAVQRTRQLGYSHIRDITTQGVSGLGFAFKASQSVIASISLGAATALLPDQRKQKLAAEIQLRIQEVADLVARRAEDEMEDANLL
ncbi:IclR family transcriptional regulator [Achromobacter xylosoxidans]|uniref:IclR family transcriptional regulator n=1 Tax=Alcaligenes xylosoxydans xylosoxydans TaxID=85698 RepID=UPI001F137D91|nr:IclR family transcriptional regulator [Achromobacter xylosoxidans]